MTHRIRRGIAAAGALVRGCCLVVLVAAAGCATTAPGAVRHPARSRPPARTVLVHGHLPDGRHWQLAAFEQGRQLGMEIEEPSGHSDSGQVGFAASRDYNYYWCEGIGPGSSIFYYGPVPAAAVSVRLTAPGWRPRLVRTAPLPGGHGLPRGRFLVVQSPSPATVSWTVVPLDSASHPVAFAAF